MFIWILGVLLMSVSTIASGESLTLILVPDARLTPARVLPLGTAPSGGAISDGTTAPQTDFEIETAPGSSNVRDVSGYYGAELRATGTPTAETTLTTTTKIPGVPSETARFVYSDGTNTLGANEPFVYQKTDTVRGVTSGNGYQYPRNTATPDGIIHYVYEDWVSKRIQYSGRVVATELYSTAVTIWTGTISFGSTYRPAPDIYWVKSDNTVGYVLYVGAWFATASGVTVFRMSASKDGGATWTNYDSDLTSTYSGSTEDYGTNLAWDSEAEQVTLAFVRETTGPVYTGKTFISQGPTGSSWQALADGDITGAKVIAMVANCGKFYLTYSTDGDSTLDVLRRDATSIDWTTVNSETGFTADDAYGLVMAVNDSGWLYRIARSSADNDEIIMQVSIDGGTTWGDPKGTYPYKDDAFVIVVDDDADAADLTLTDGILMTGACWSSETMWVSGNLVTGAGNTDNSAVSMMLGGFSNLTQDGNPSGVDTPMGVGSLPTAKSNHYSFSTSGSTTQTIALDSANRLVHQINNHDSTGLVFYTFPSDPTVGGAIWIIGSDTDGGVSDDLIVVGIATHDIGNGNKIEVQIRVDWDNNTMQMYDERDNALIGSAVPFVNSKDLHLILAADGENVLVSGYMMQPGDAVWTDITVGHTPVQSVGGANNQAQFGKLGTGTQTIDTLDFIPIGSPDTAFLADLAAGNFPAALVPARATGKPQLIPTQLMHLWFHGSPLHAADTNTATAVSKTPLANLSPHRALASPTVQYVGPSGAAGATYREVFDLGASEETRLALNSLGLAGANMGPCEEIRGRSWRGSSWTTEVAFTGFERPFGADGAVSFVRSGTNSTFFTPNGVNGTPIFNNLADWRDRWVRIGISGQLVLAQIRAVHPGQYSNVSGIMQSAIELDLSTIVVETGSFTGIGTSTTAGTFNLYADDFMCVAGGQSIDATRYYALEWDLANAETVPRGGFLTMGPVYYISHAERDGSSARWVSADDLRKMPGTGFVQGEKVRRREQRVLELPYDSILVQAGYFGPVGNVINTQSISGSTAHMTIDNNLQMIRSIHSIVGQLTPIWVAPAARFAGTDPGSVNLGIYGRDVICGTMERQVDITAAMGRLNAIGSHAQQGGRLLVSERI